MYRYQPMAHQNQTVSRSTSRSNYNSNYNYDIFYNIVSSKLLLGNFTMLTVNANAKSHIISRFSTVFVSYD